MKNKGFTLVELLAVIVILAIIALIAVPIILGIIKDTKKEADKRSIEMYASALKNAVVQYQLDGKKLEVNKLETDDGRNFSNVPDLKVEYDGDVVCKTIIVYEEGDVYLDDCKVNKKTVAYAYGTKGDSSDSTSRPDDDSSDAGNNGSETKQHYDNGDIVYFDVDKGIGCTEEKYKESWTERVNDFSNSIAGYNGLEATKEYSVQNSCLKFYSFLDDGSDKLNLLLDHNTSSNFVDWTTDFYNSSGPDAALQELYENTKDWKGTETPSPYTYNHSTSDRKYTIEYSEYKARLITAQEVAKITGADKALNWNETSTKSDWYYLDGSTGTATNWQEQVTNSANKSKYYWLFDRTSSCLMYGCQVQYPSDDGYWTSAAYPSDEFNAWVVYAQGSLLNYETNIGGHGIRPVITVQKSNI